MDADTPFNLPTNPPQRMVTSTTTDREALMELIRKQPPMSSERFWQQVERARAWWPNVEPPRVDSETKLEKSEPTEKETPAKSRDVAGV
jgi:hypothetical protein